MSLNTKATGMALGSIAGLVWLVMMGFSLLSGIGVRTVTTLGSYHPYFSYSWIGLVVMVVEHLSGGFILGWVFANLYNYFLKK